MAKKFWNWAKNEGSEERTLFLEGAALDSLVASLCMVGHDLITPRDVPATMRLFRQAFKCLTVKPPGIAKELSTLAWRILLDCANLDYVSSAGLRVLFEIAAKLQELSGRLACCSVNGNVRKVFDLVELPADIPVFANEEESLK